MTLFSCHMTTYPWRWGFAIALAALLFCRGVAALALSPAPGTAIVNTVSAQHKDANGNARPATDASATFALHGAPVLHLHKTAASDPAAAGALLTYTLQYENSGNTPATGVRIVETLPPTVTFQSASGGGVYDPDHRTVTWTIGNLVSGGSGSCTVTVKLAEGLAAGTPIVNATQATSTEGAEAASVLTTTVGIAANLVITESVSPAITMPGGIITYTISYRNSGNADARQVRVKGQIPSGTAYLQGSATVPENLVGNLLTWDLGDIAAGNQGSLQFKVRVSPLAETGQRISASASILSADQTKNSPTVVTDISAQTMIQLKIAAPDIVHIGQATPYRLQIENTGAVPLTGVILSNPLPAGTTFVSADSGGILAAGSRQVDWNIGALAAGEKRTATLNVLVGMDLVNGQLIENIASITSNETGPQTVKAISSVTGRTEGVVGLFDAAWQPAYGYMHGDTVYVQVADLDQNGDPTVAETISLVIKDLKTGDTETVLVTETGPNSGIFRSAGIRTTLDTTPADDGTLTVAANARIQAIYTDPLDGSPVATALALIDPLGIVFDSTTGVPVAGTVVTLRNWNAMSNECDITSVPVLPPGQINPALPTGTDGRFAFPLVSVGDYCFQVTPPASHTFPSKVTDADLPTGFTIGNGSRGEKFTLSVGDPPLVRDIPVDPPAGRLSITKTANKAMASIGDIVAYSLILTNDGGAPVTSITISDIMPHGVHYLPGSSRINGQLLSDPTATGSRTIAWQLPGLASGKSLEITYRSVVGVDSSKGDGINTVLATGTSVGQLLTSNTARVKIRIRDGVFTEQGTVIGKIFHDRDGNRLQNQPDTPEDPTKQSEPGIPNVALYLEDGTRVITDRSGKFSLVGIMPGTHVLRVDETTLPKGMVLVPLANRFLGDGASQFVAMQPGGLVQADFAVKLTVKDTSSQTKPAVATPLVADGSRSAAARDMISPHHEPPEAGNVPGMAPPHARGAPGSAPPPVTEVRGSTSVEGAPETGSVGTRPAHAGKQGGPDWEEKIKTMQPGLGFLSPTDGAVLTRERIRVVIKVPFGTEPSLSVNAKPVAAKQIGRKIDYEQGRVTIFEYIDIHLTSGEANRLKAEIKDQFGITRGAQEIIVSAAGAPERIHIRTDKPEVPADGSSVIRVNVSFRDRADRIVPYAAFATVSVSAGEIVEKDADPNQEDVQILIHEGVGHFTIRAPRETGEAVIMVGADGRQESTRVFFTPNLRSIFLVGTGEVMIGHGRGTGEYTFLKNNSWFDKGVYTGGRGALFLKGKVFDDLLLTAAYDSDKQKRDDLFRENDTTLDGEDKYPIYGDESKTGYEAVSADKLYLKLEKNRSYLLYGDYRTDLNDTRLAAYNRTFNGLKYDLNMERFKLRSFASYTDQTQVMDILPGKGISGYYYLTKRQLIEGSERVTIETRDRYRPDNVLNRESKERGADYEIDYDLGAILFKEPIPSHDSNYDPVYIVVSYESRHLDDKYYIYGGRGAFKPDTWLEVGGTGIVEEKALGNARLIGTDVTMTLPLKTTIKAEYAATKTVFEQSGLFDWHSGEAWSLHMASEPIDKMLLTGYYRTLADYFLNPSAVDSSRGTTKYGVDAAYELRPDTRIQGKYFNERDDLNTMRHQLASLGFQTKFKKTKLTGAVSNESSTDSYIPLTNPTNRSPFDISQETPHALTDVKIGIETELRPGLALTASHKQNLSQESYHMSQAGVNYQLNSQNRLYLREEYQKYQERTETRTLLGVETQFLKNTVAYNEYRLADGADGSRNQSVLGLRNKFFLGRNLTGNAAAEYLRTISGSQRSAEPDAVAGSLGLEYLASEQAKVTGRFEHRRELIDKGRESYLGEVGTAYKLNPDYSLLLRERYFTEDTGIGGQHTTSRMMVGLAYRPLQTNRFNALTKLEYKHESNAASIPAFREDAVILAGEGIWQATPRLQITGKYAGKLVSDEGFSSYTDLVAARFVYDLADRWDVGAEYRILTSHAINSCYQGGTVEIGYRVIKNLWVAAGYSFDKFDADLAGETYQGEGPYLKLRIKFDENIWRSSK